MCLCLCVLGDTPKLLYGKGRETKQQQNRADGKAWTENEYATQTYNEFDFGMNQANEQDDVKLNSNATTQSRNIYYYH